MSPQNNEASCSVGYFFAGKKGIKWKDNQIWEIKLLIPLLVMRWFSPQNVKATASGCCLRNVSIRPLLEKFSSNDSLSSIVKPAASVFAWKKKKIEMSYPLKGCKGLVQQESKPESNQELK